MINIMITQNIIKNKDKLATTRLRKRALGIIEAGFRAVDIGKIIKKTIKIKGEYLYIKGINKNQKFKLPKGKLYLIGIGKGSYQIAKALEKKLGERIYKGLVLDIKGGKLNYLKSRIGTHPLPSLKNVQTTKEIINILKKAEKDDLILFIICGGGSALASAPDGLKINKFREINKKLINSGADIYEINTIRKHLSLFKGGQAVKLAYPARVISLIVSDVAGDDLKVIASGSTVKDNTTIRDAERIAKKYKISGIRFKETPKEAKYFKKVSNILFLSNKIPLKTMAEKARDLGYKTKIYSFKVQGEARELGRKLLTKARREASKVILAGGETTVKVKGRRKGGRNQELVLGALSYLQDNELIISIASDGRDNSKAAGAIGDRLTVEKAGKMNLDVEKYLSNNDSFHFFQKTNDLIYTEEKINLADFIILMK